MEQFNVSQEAAVEQFNVSQENAFTQFNAQNGLVVSQANAQWRRQIATQDTAAINQVNQLNAQNALAMNIREYEGLWQEKRDQMQFAFNSAESVLDRENELAKMVLQANSTIDAAKYGMAGDMGGALGEVLSAVAGAKYTNSRSNTVVNNSNSGSNYVINPFTNNSYTSTQGGGSPTPGGDSSSYYGAARSPK